MDSISADDAYLKTKQSLQFQKYNDTLTREIDDSFIQPSIHSEKVEFEKSGNQTNVDGSEKTEIDWVPQAMIGGHNGWVRCVEIDTVSNKWFATGSADSNIKIWNILPDEAGHRLVTTLQGHVMGVRDIEISFRNPYLFSCSEDKMIKCWDLETNQIIRDYHGHLSGVYSVVQHPSFDQIIVSAGRDSTAKVWDIRSRRDVMTLVGHKQAINKVICFPAEPQIVTCSNDNTIRLWDLRNGGKPLKIITNHDKHVRDIVKNPNEFSFASCSTNSIMSWALPKGEMLSRFTNQEKEDNLIKPLGIVNTLSVSKDDILFAGTDGGDMIFYDYLTNKKLKHKSSVYYSSDETMDDSNERGVLCSSFDKTGEILITGEVDKFIKIWNRQA